MATLITADSSYSEGIVRVQIRDANQELVLAFEDDKLTFRKEDLDESLIEEENEHDDQSD